MIHSRTTDFLTNVRRPNKMNRDLLTNTLRREKMRAKLEKPVLTVKYRQERKQSDSARALRRYRSHQSQQLKQAMVKVRSELSKVT